jgi:hypothetical protein
MHDGVPEAHGTIGEMTEARELYLLRRIEALLEENASLKAALKAVEET